jgi:hypothetical protein
MSSIEDLEKREIEISSRIQQRLKIHLDMLTQVQQNILHGVDLMTASTQRIDLDNPLGHLQFLSTVFASRVVTIGRSSVFLCSHGYALETAVLARSLFEISVIYKHLLDNATDTELFLDGKISPTEVVKRALRQTKNQNPDDDVGLAYGILSDFAHHSQWALAHGLDWEEGEREFVTFHVLIDDPEIIDPILRQVFDWMFRFYSEFYDFVSAKFPTDTEWLEQHSFILEFRDIFDSTDQR